MNGYSDSFAVILAGCGRADGTEITEAVSVLIALSKLGAEYRCFAPDRVQREVVDHRSGAVVAGATRNCLTEAARIARGAIEPLEVLRAADFAGVIFPGGFGAAKNLCDFAARGAAMTVAPDVERILCEFHGARKPIGLCCIAPILAAKVFGSTHVEITLGAKGPASAAAESWGARHIVKRVDQAHADTTQRVVTAPAYMDDAATPNEVYLGIEAMVRTVVEMAEVSPRLAAR
ncbi:isoprenoid biosynthesis glyoxalase ElbB [soil metagenome]